MLARGGQRSDKYLQGKAIPVIIKPFIEAGEQSKVKNGGKQHLQMAGTGPQPQSAIGSGTAQASPLAPCGRQLGMSANSAAPQN